MTLMNYIIRRLLISVVILFFISIIIFGLIQAMPGDPFWMYLDNPHASLEQIEMIKELHGLNRPLPIQYLYWLRNVAMGNLGVSFQNQLPVIQLIGQRVPATLQLMSFAFLLALIVAVPIGVFSAIKKNSFLDYACTTFSYFGISMPTFWFGMMLQLTFALRLGWLPSSGRRTIGGEGGDFADILSHMILPGVVLALLYLASWSRYTRDNYIDVLSQDYIRTASAKGVSDFRLYGIHALRNATMPLVTVITIDLPAMFSGAIVTEAVFNWPGVGSLFMMSIQRRDYPILMGILLISAILVVLFNLIADILYALLDPRIKY